MSLSDRRAHITIPASLPVDTLLKALERGHDYRWTRVTTKPVLVVHGFSSSGLPQLLIVNNSIIAEDGQPAFVEGLTRLIAVLSGGR
ncbi:MAG: hypothetical protein HXY34_00520 [Candidatus Thorarchaeota archaeon]|nr:hypothetical protein [Candidatus Thorarchaeota archaeon]